MADTITLESFSKFDTTSLTSIGVQYEYGEITPEFVEMYLNAPPEVRAQIRHNRISSGAIGRLEQLAMESVVASGSLYHLAVIFRQNLSGTGFTTFDSGREFTAKQFAELDPIKQVEFKTMLSNEELGSLTEKLLDLATAGMRNPWSDPRTSFVLDNKYAGILQISNCEFDESQVGQSDYCRAGEPGQDEGIEIRSRDQVVLNVTFTPLSRNNDAVERSRDIYQLPLSPVGVYMSFPVGDIPAGEDVQE